MRRSIVILLVLSLSILAGTTALGATGSGVGEAPVIQIFDDAGNALGAPHEVVGVSRLIRRDDGLKATAKISGLIPGGVYTFWWVAIPEGGAFPLDAFVARGGGKVVGLNGNATVRMKAEYGQASIKGFVDDTSFPFQPLTFDLAEAEVHVEIAYHGQASQAGDELDQWLSDFWTGSACPAVGEQAETQPHCPVSFVAIHPGA